MVKDYIERLILEEEDEIEKLQLQMKKSLAELQSSQEWLENLQREKNIDYNIFSPRKFDAEADEKIEKARAAVREHDQNVEYIRRQIESHVKRNQEYLKMQEEDAEGNANAYTNVCNEISKETDTVISGMEKVFDASAEEIEKATDISTEKTGKEIADISAEKEIKETADALAGKEIKETPDVSTEKETKETHDTSTEKEIKEIPDISAEKAELITFLKKIYKKTEISLALLNGDKNKCKNEMKNMMHEIKKYVSELEKNEKM